MAALSKTKTSSGLHAVVGSDEAEVKRAARELAAQLGPGGDFGMDVIDGAVGDSADTAAERIHATIEALLTFPFFGGKKLVWLKSATFLADTPTGRAAATTEALEQLAATLSKGLPPGTRFLLSAVGADKRRTFYKTLLKLAAGQLQVFDKLDTSRPGWEQEAAQLARAAARARGLVLQEEALELFALFTGGERRAVENELEKLDLYLGPARREATAEDVRLLVPLSRPGIIFELGNAVAERNLHRALRLLDQLMFQGESAIGILLAVLIPTVRNLLLSADLIARHKLSRPGQPFAFTRTLERLPEEATAHLPRKKDGTVNTFSLGIAACQAHRHRPADLREALAACLEANVSLVTSPLDARVVLSQLIVRIAGSAQAARN